MDECDDDISDLNISKILTDKEKDLWFNKDDKYFISLPGVPH